MQSSNANLNWTSNIKPSPGFGRILPSAAVIWFLCSVLMPAIAGIGDPKPASGIPAQLSASVGVSHMTFVDPKTGKLIWMANVEQFNAQTGEDGTVIGVMRNVDGVLFENGKAEDRLKSNTVTADSANKVVTAEGGVTITSLTLADTRITCDRVVWYTAKNKMFGTGHVVFHTGGFTQSAPSFLADTKLKDVTMPDPNSRFKQHGHVSF